MKTVQTFVLSGILIPFLTSCSSMNRTTKGGVIGAGAGGAIGGVIGKQAGNTAVGAILGATIGGITGASIGHYMDKQAEDLRRDLKNAKVERVGEGIKITFNSGILFTSDSAQLQPVAAANLNELAKTMNKYKDTQVLVEGNTDSTGNAQYNRALSENRANAVSTYLKTQNVDPTRIMAVGHGEDNPVADNNTAIGRQANRRVEVAIFANDKLKKAAEAGQL